MGVEGGVATKRAKRRISSGVMEQPANEEPTLDRSVPTSPEDRAVAGQASQGAVQHGKNLGRKRNLRPVVGAYAVGKDSGSRTTTAGIRNRVERHNSREEDKLRFLIPRGDKKSKKTGCTTDIEQGNPEGEGAHVGSSSSDPPETRSFRRAERLSSREDDKLGLRTGRKKFEDSVRAKNLLGNLDNEKTEGRSNIEHVEGPPPQNIEHYEPSGLVMGSTSRMQPENEIQVDTFSESCVHDEINVNAHEATVSSNTNFGTPLIEAVLVTEESFQDEENRKGGIQDEDIVEAELVKSSDPWQNPKVKIILAMILLLIAVVAIMAVVLVGNRDRSGKSENEERDASPSSSGVEVPSMPPLPANTSEPKSTPTPLPATNMSTIAPTACHSNIFAYPMSSTWGCNRNQTKNGTITPRNSTLNMTEAPTLAPSPSSTVFDIGRFNWTDPLNLNLPNRSVAAIYDPTSPQAKAYQWLELHPNIDNMTEWKKQQLYAMATFYKSLNGDGWEDKVGEDKNHESLHWLNYTVDECLWGEQDSRGTKCNETSGKLTQIWLDDLDNVQGTIAPEVALLSSLEFLGMESTDWNSSLEDAWPREISKMQQLRWLHYENCRLTGTIPTYVGTFTHLNRLRFNLNLVTGPMPTELGLLTSLELFYPSENKLTSTLPTELAAMRELVMMRINGNEFEGPIPSEYGNLKSMNHLSMFENAFSGSIPSELGLMTALTHLTLYSNELTSTIPTEFGRLTNLKVLWLNSNELIGPLPSEIGLLTALTSMKLQDNDLTGVMPPEICQLVKTQRLAPVEVGCARLACSQECCSCCGSTSAC